MKQEHQNLGLAGNLAKAFITSKLTLLISIISVLIGVGAILITPKEEEPQISVPMIDIHLSAPGFNGHEVEKKAVEPIEREMWGLEGVEYVYSMSRDHGAIVTVRFKVGEPLNPSLVKVHDKLMMVKSVLPTNVVVPEVKSFTIDDVPFLAVTFSSPTINDYELRQLVAPLARELQSAPDLSRVELFGGLKKVVRIYVNKNKMRDNHVSLSEIAGAIQQNSQLMPVGKNWSSTNVLDVEVGKRFENIDEIKMVAIGQRAGHIVRLSDVADVKYGPEERTRASLYFDKNEKSVAQNAVSLVFTKRAGTNVVSLSRDLLTRIDNFKNEHKEVNVNIIRDYGKTANDKTIELIEHLIIATLSVIVLIILAMGWRASLVVAIAIPVTLSLTLAIYYFMGYTLNRVTLFALIFSIGILVDDAIVVVENIERYLSGKKKLSMIDATLRAVSEVGNPTILATITVIGAILPMAFVRGMMGPYMLPIPVGASLAMILSLIVAFVVTPWASVKILKAHSQHEEESDTQKVNFADRIYLWVTNRILGTKKNAFIFSGVTLLLLLTSMSLVYFKSVKVKMLPFDNKSEFQVTLDYEPNTSLEKNKQLTQILVKRLMESPEVEKIQSFSGLAAPFSFSGMVKHTFLRESDYMSDLQIVLKDKEDRKKKGHDIVNELRPIITQFSKEYNVVSKVLEIPPGPPVMSTMVAEIYAPTEKERVETAIQMKDIFASIDSVVDLDITTRPIRSSMFIPFDPARAHNLGVRSAQLVNEGQYLFNETNLGFIKEFTSPEEVAINLSVDNSLRSSSRPFGSQLVPSFEAGRVDLDRVVGDTVVKENRILYRKNLRPVEYVMSEIYGTDEAPVYAMMKISPKVPWPATTASIPSIISAPHVKWDGEWFITYEVFRDMGLAFAVVMILIYVLVVGWFKSFTVPLVIMAPIPISLIGVLPAHAMFGAYFTATSMIGFIAGAGIIVRNSIILVDFIEEQIKSGMDLKEAVISAGILRFRPMLLTAAAVVVGSSVMLFDPIFQGLAISLMFGEIAATLISRFMVPLLYYWFLGKTRIKDLH